MTPASRRSIVWPILLIIAAGVLAYASSFDGILVFDDEPSIADNPNIRSLWPLTRAMAAPPDTTLAGRPIASLTFAINYALARDARDLWGYHAVNLAIHILAALVLFGIVRRTLASTRMRERFGAAATPLAFVTALIWLVHPLQTGSVTYVVQRVESLMGLFYLLTLYCAIRAADDGPAEAGDGPAKAGDGPAKAGPYRKGSVGSAFRRTSGQWITGAIVACALGMATKEVMVTAPLMVLLWDWTFGSSGFESRRSRWPLYAGLAATWMIAAALAATGPRVHSVGFSFPDWPWPTYLITQAGVVAHYLRLAIVPSPLVLDYEWPAAHSIVDVAPQATMLLALIAVTIWALVRRLPIGFAGAWFFGILAPTSSVIPIVTEIAAEHRMYLPLAAVIAVGVIGVYAIWPRTLPRLVLALLAGAVVAAFAFLTDARSRDYHDYERIWLDTIQKRPSNSRARNNYASALLVHGRYAEAEDHLRAAVQMKPDFAEAHVNLGVVLCARGAFDEGIAHLQRAVAIQPDYWQAYQDLGEAFASQGRFAPAISSYAKALEGRTNDVMLLNRIAWILATSSDADLRDGARAATLAERAVRLTNREDAASLDSLAAAYAELGRYDDAATTVREALVLARKKGDPAIAPELESRLALYQAHRPFREAAVRRR